MQEIIYFWTPVGSGTGIQARGVADEAAGAPEEESKVAWDRQPRIVEDILMDFLLYPKLIPYHFPCQIKKEMSSRRASSLPHSY